MRCFKKEKRSKRKTRPCARDRGRSGEMNKKERKPAVAGYARSCAYISYAGGGCFAWPRQYYYHIFRIMRSRVCLLFHATPPLATLVAATRGSAGSMMHFNVLSFIVRPVLFYTLYVQYTSMKTLYATAMRSIGICLLTLLSMIYLDDISRCYMRGDKNP